MSRSDPSIKDEEEKTLPEEESGLNPLEEKRMRVLTDFLRKEVELEKKLRNIPVEKKKKKRKYTLKEAGEVSEEEDDEGDEEDEDEEEESSSEEEVMVKVPIRKKDYKIEKTPLKRRPVERMVEKGAKRITKRISSRAAQGLAEMGKKLFTFV